jgi:hypothetical protein
VPRSRVAGGDVDVERSVVLGDALPDLEDRRAVRRSRNRRRHRCRRRADLTAAPRRVVRGVAVEVEVEHSTRRGSRIECEHVGGQRASGQRRHDLPRLRGLQRVGVTDEAGIGDEHRRVLEEFLPQLLRLETGGRSDFVEGVGLLQLLDGLPPLGHIEIAAFERADVGLFEARALRTISGVAGNREGMRPSRRREAGGQSDDERATSHRCPLEPASIHDAKVATPTRNRSAGAPTHPGRDSAGTDDRFRHCTDCWD